MSRPQPPTNVKPAPIFRKGIRQIKPNVRVIPKHKPYEVGMGLVTLKEMFLAKISYEGV